MKIHLYDTTLRDGTQAEGVSFSAEDKVRVAKRLDEFGIDYIEGGWPGSNPRDIEFFQLIRNEKLKHAKIAAFGSTRHRKYKPEEDPNLAELLNARCPVVTIFGKSWDLHVTKALRVSFEDNLDMIASSVKYLKSKKREVIYDAEHFFDGYKANPEYAIKTLQAAADGGADCLVLCDTNGGCFPWEIEDIVKTVQDNTSLPVGIHTHNDGGLAVANALAAVRVGATHMQGTINGYGERCGNMNLCTAVPNLVIKMEKDCSCAKKLNTLTPMSLYISELANALPDDRQPFVGRSSFAHKGGIHVSAVQREGSTYEHIRPELVGNERRVLISDLSGKSNIEFKSHEIGVDFEKDPDAMKRVLKVVKSKENEGWNFEAADASLEILMRKELGSHKNFFELAGFRVITERNPARVHIDGREIVTEATVKIKVGERTLHTAAEGDGPVNALDGALRKALKEIYPELSEVHLTDYKVRVLDAREGTAAKVRVLIESRDHENEWSTVGVSENIIEASYLALVDSIDYKLLKYKNKAKKGGRKKAARKSAARKKS
jgi:2-isopropylmalate synthase